MSNPDSETYADRVIREALAGASFGLDLELVTRVMTDCLEAMGKQMAAMKAAQYPPAEYDRIARAFAHVAKSLDAVYRLVEFARGRPDSRSAPGADWLSGLTDAQLQQVQAWVEDNERTFGPTDAEAPGRPRAPRLPDTPGR
jgi:hypothetical protein